MSSFWLSAVLGSVFFFSLMDYIFPHNETPAKILNPVELNNFLFSPSCVISYFPLHLFYKKRLNDFFFFKSWR